MFGRIGDIALTLCQNCAVCTSYIKFFLAKTSFYNFFVTKKYTF